MTKFLPSLNLAVNIVDNFVVSGRPYLDYTTACSIVTSIVHSKLDYAYCNSLYYNIPKTQKTRLKQTQ